MTARPYCTQCQSTGWVCENHPDKAWDVKDGGCNCGAGMPCPVCNNPEDWERPRLPPDFEVDVDIDTIDDEPKKH
jgi:hypothetical protein